MSSLFRNVESTSSFFQSYVEEGESLARIVVDDVERAHRTHNGEFYDVTSSALDPAAGGEPPTADSGAHLQHHSPPTMH